MALDFRPQWETGQATIGEVAAQLDSIKVVFAGYEVAANAGLALSHYVLLGDGHRAGQWEMGVMGRVTPRASMPWEAPGAQTFEPVIDIDRIHRAIAHWKRLVSFGDWTLVVKDVITDTVVATSEGATNASATQYRRKAGLDRRHPLRT